MTGECAIFLGITGASGAPYAVRLLQALVAAECEVGVCASSAGIEVIGTEVYGDPRLPRDEVLARMTEGAGDAVTVYDPSDWGSPYASGSAKVDGYVVCPCSMSTLATIASGAMQNLVHRAASVALKEERKLVLMPRETPLSTIHLETMLTAKRAGATILFLAPGFYHGAESVDDLVDFIVGRALDQLGLDNALVKRWGDAVNVRSGTLPPERVRDDVRPDRAGLRRDEPRHDGRARPALAPRDRQGGRRAGRPRARRRAAAQAISRSSPRRRART